MLNQNYFEHFSYQNYIFDCDGVILDSNNIKSEVFYQLALPYGKDIAETFVDYHQRNGGISRFEKFKYLFEDMLKIKGADFNHLLRDFSAMTLERIKIANEIPGVQEFIKKLPPESKKFVVSGGAEEDLKIIFQYKKFDVLFDGIFGSPRDKYQIVKKIKNDFQTGESFLYFGDSILDYEVASFYNMDFVFIYESTAPDDFKKRLSAGNERNEGTSVKFIRNFLQVNP
ncbi:MAG: HAD hydrolase-like protein [Oligoflexia bacterium]|nr:HAD hydrolase-like protein [Oligoflexia bacterium]